MRTSISGEKGTNANDDQRRNYRVLCVFVLCNSSFRRDFQEMEWGNVFGDLANQVVVSLYHGNLKSNY